MINNFPDSLSMMRKVASKNPNYNPVLDACRLADSKESKNIYFISQKVTEQIQESILPYMTVSSDYLVDNPVIPCKKLSYGDAVGGVEVLNADILGMDFPIPNKDQVICFDGGESKLIRVYVRQEKDQVDIIYTISADSKYLDVGIIEIFKDKIIFASPSFGKEKNLNPQTMKFFIALAMVKFLFEKLLNKNYKYELRKATKFLKKRKVQPIKSDYKYISLDYMSLDEIKTVFKYESRNIQGSPKAPHDRSAHIRKLRSGKEVLIKSSKVRGGSKAVKFVNVK